MRRTCHRLARRSHTATVAQNANRMCGAGSAAFPHRRGDVVERRRGGVRATAEERPFGLWIIGNMVRTLSIADATRRNFATTRSASAPSNRLGVVTLSSPGYMVSCMPTPSSSCRQRSPSNNSASGTTAITALEIRPPAPDPRPSAPDRRQLRSRCRSSPGPTDHQLADARSTGQSSRCSRRLRPVRSAFIAPGCPSQLHDATIGAPLQ